jgi:hypothetical protein
MIKNSRENYIPKGTQDYTTNEANIEQMIIKM